MRPCLLLPFFAVATTAVWVVGPVASADDVVHPNYASWSSRPEGTSVTLRTRTEAKGHVITTTTTTTLKKLKPEVAILEVVKVSDATGTEIKNKPEVYEQYRAFPLFPGVKKEDIGKPTGAKAKGEETLTLSGKEYKAVWFDSKTKGDGNLDWLSRTWMSDEIPGRVLKSVIQIPAASTTITTELIDFKLP